MTMTTQSPSDRIAELEQLAAHMLASFAKGQDGYRARAGQIQIARWNATLAGIRAEPPGGPLPEPVGAGRDIEEP